MWMADGAAPSLSASSWTIAQLSTLVEAAWNINRTFRATREVESLLLAACRSEDSDRED